MATDLDEYAPHWINERFPPDQWAQRRDHQWRAYLRQLFFAVAILSLLIPSLIFNYLIGDLNLIRIVAGIIPGIIAAVTAMLMAGIFVKTVFGLHSWWDGFRYATMCVFGRPWPLRYPFAIINEGKIRERDRHKFIADRRLGGPGRLNIHNDSAVVLERYGRISGIEGPGIVFVERFEHIREILDLRPQTKTEAGAQICTKDGINIKTDITVRFQIKADGFTLETPYPANEAALEKAARAEMLRIIGRGAPTRLAWKDRVVGVLSSTLREIVAGKTLDELFEPTDLNKDPRDEISRELLSQLRTQAAANGVDILDVILGPFSPVSPSVEQQRRAAWLATRLAEDRLEEARGEAGALLARKTAYAYAQLEMMQTIDRGFQRLARRDEKLPATFIALNFLETLRRMASSPGLGPFLPLETMRTLDSLNELLLGRPSPPTRPAAALDKSTPGEDEEEET